MALYIESGNGPVITWHVGEGALINRVDSTDRVTAVQADGDELYHISHCIDGIPFNRRNKVNRWSGENARFIVENL